MWAGPQPDGCAEAGPRRESRGMTPPPLSPVVLEGRHVRLEPLTPEHLPALTAVGLEPSLWEWSPMRVSTPEEMRAYVESALADRGRGVALPFVTLDRATGEALGSTRFGNYDAANRRVEIGWTWITPSRQRTPVNTEAKYLQLRHAFETLELGRVEWKTDLLNVRSRVAIARLGAREEGTLRRHMICDTGRVRDTVYYSVIAEEWPAVRTRLEKFLRGDAWTSAR